MQLDLEHRFFSCEFLGLVILREGHLDVKLFARLMVNDLLLKARNKLAGTERQAEVFRLAAFESDIVDKSFKVDHSDVTVLRSAVFHRHHAGVAVLHLSDFCVNRFVGHGNFRLLRFNALISLDLHFRLGGDGRLENKTVLAGGNEVKINFIFNHVKLRFVDSLFQCVRIERIDRILIEDLLAIIFLDKSARSLSLAEARDHNFLVLLMVCLIHRFFKSFAVDFNFQLIAIGVNLIA